MYKRSLLLTIILTFSLNLTAGLTQSRLTEDTGRIFRFDIDKDGDPDIIERWFNGKRCRWIDENDDMLETDMLGDIVSDCLQVDSNGDGYYDGYEDMSVKWVDNDNDGVSDAQVIVINAKKEQDNKWSGHGLYMVFQDIDNDNVMGYMNWSRFDLACWHNTGRCNFIPDYNGNSLFLKAHKAPYVLQNAKYNWENPFAFYDFDDDECTEMAVRFVDDYLCNGKLNSGYVSFDIDNDSQRDNEFDYDFSLYFSKGENYDYSGHINKYPDLKAASWVLPYFQHTEWRVIDELAYVPHDKCFDRAFEIDWGSCYFVFDEDDDDHRWERVELYYPQDAYVLRDENTYSNLRKGPEGPMNGHPQADSLGDRGEFDADNSGKGKLYISKWDGRLHLYGAEWGAWIIDSKAQYNGSLFLPRGCSKKMATELESVVLYYDTDNNGFFDLVKFDYDADEKYELVVNLLEYGNDECKLLDPAELTWQGLHDEFRQNAEKCWLDAHKLYRVAWRKGITDKETDDLAFASSVWEKYLHGSRLKEAIFMHLASRFKGDSDNLKLLHKFYFSGDFESMADWMLSVDLN